MTTPAPSTGGDMAVGVARAHLETADEIAATPTDYQTKPRLPYQNQHAKVVRLEISIGKDDDHRTIEQFEADIREALGIMAKAPHNIITQGAYYILDGMICMPEDYDEAVKNRKPGTYPPQWAGGPAKGKEAEWTLSHKDFAAPTPTIADRAAAVTELAQGINTKVKAKGKLVDPEQDPAVATRRKPTVVAELPDSP